MTRVRIVGRELPGLRCGGYNGVHVGVQHRRDVVDLVPGDAPRAEFDLDVDVRDGDFRGPFVHGRRGERFLYLSWGTVGADGTFTMFRRAKLHLSAVPDELLDEVSRGAGLVGELPLTDECGMPRCASVRPPQITWRAVGGNP